MKKHFKLILLILIVNQVSLAQKNNKIFYGLKIGSNYNFGNTSSDENKNKFGFYAGGFIGFSITDEVKIKPEILYSKYKKTENLENVEVAINNTNFPIILLGKYKYEIKEESIQLPIIIEYSFSKKIYGEFGPQFGYFFRREIIYNETENFPFPNGRVLTKLNETFDYGIALGLGLNLTSNIAIQSRINIGFIESDYLANLGFEIEI